MSCNKCNNIIIEKWNTCIPPIVMSCSRPVVTLLIHGELHLSLFSPAPLYSALTPYTTRKPHHRQQLLSGFKTFIIFCISTFFSVLISPQITEQTKDATATRHKPEADSEVWPSEVLWPPPHRAVDAGLALQRERPHLESRVSAVGEEFRGLRPARESRYICAQEELGSDWLRRHAGKWERVKHLQGKVEADLINPRSTRSVVTFY